MNLSLRKCAVAIVSALGVSVLSVDRGTAQSYPIDCAILLCLSGGWPASAPCARARAEFIRRVTPWPVEPPLQIWRCPMGASFEQERGYSSRLDTVKVRLPHEKLRRHRSPLKTGSVKPQLATVPRFAAPRMEKAGEESPLRLVQKRADIDISGSEFDFVRSIRVFDVRFATQMKAGENEVCRRFATVYLGTYGAQGDFSWQTSSPGAIPDAHVGLEGWGDDCPVVANRSVFVDWRDFEGKYGFEQVNY